MICSEPVIPRREDFQGKDSSFQGPEEVRNEAFGGIKGKLCWKLICEARLLWGEKGGHQNLLSLKASVS